MSLKEYYSYYLLLHQHPKCRLMHFLGQIATIAFVFGVVAIELWPMLLVTPFVVYPFAWSGHYFFEKNKPAAFSSPLYAKISDWIMFKDILLRRITIW